MNATLAAAPPLHTERDASQRALRLAIIAIAGTAWLSGAIFGAYILAYYVGAIPAGTPENWNSVLPRLYDGNSTPAANVGIGVHFLLGAILLLLGPLQLIASVRARWPRFHRWVGWTYAPSAILTGLGGLLYIALRGTVGGPLMSVAFALYGVLTALAGVETLRHAMARRIARHRAWAIRLFALAIGSWLYRMDYGFWFLFFGPLGHTDSFTGWFDYVMDFWFFLPNLIVAEIAIRSAGPGLGSGARWLAATALFGATAFLLLATYFFTTRSWGIAILWRFGLWE